MLPASNALAELVDAARRRGWEAPRLTRWLVGLALAAGGGLVVHGWRAVAALPFHAGLLLCAAGLAGLSWLAARGGASALVWLLNTSVCLLVGCVLVDRFWFGREHTPGDALASYSFLEAQGDPDAFLRWHARALAEQKHQRRNTMKDPSGVNPHVLTPGQGQSFTS